MASDDGGRLKQADTLKAVAEHFGVDERTVKRWRQQDYPGLQSVPYDLDAIAKHRKTKRNHKKAQKQQEVAGNDVTDITEVNRRYKLAATKVKELDGELRKFQLALKRGEIMLTADVEVERSSTANKIRETIMQMKHAYSDKILNVTEHDVAVTTLEEIATDLLRRLSGTGV